MAGQTTTTIGIGRSACESQLVGGLVFAGRAAGFAVHEAIGADANVDHRLAKAAEFITLARGFGLFALRAFISGGTGSGAHESNVSVPCAPRKMTLVIVVAEENAHPARLSQRNNFSVAYNSQQ
jgi:hypothetical protein